MSNILYIAEKTSVVNSQLLEEMGIAGNFDSGQITQRDIDLDGDRACLFGCCDSKKLRYEPDAQRWIAGRNKKYRLGFSLDSKPGPEQLARGLQVPGHPVTLADGADWMIPVARCFPEGSWLPQVTMLGADNKLITEIMPEYIGLWNKAEKLWEYLSATLEKREPESTPDDVELWLLAAEAIGVNYRVGIDEINLLGLLTTQNLALVYGAVVDLPSIVKILSKKKR